MAGPTLGRAKEGRVGCGLQSAAQAGMRYLRTRASTSSDLQTCVRRVVGGSEEGTSSCQAEEIRNQSRRLSLRARISNPKSDANTRREQRWDIHS